MGLPVLRTREPGGAQGAERLRGLLLDPEADWSPFAETLLHFAARAEHLARTIRPTLAAGMWVVCDRFADSTMAYQGYGLEGDRGRIAALTAMLDVRPDLTLVLDVPVETSVVRLRGRGGQVDRYEKLGADFFARIRNGFRLIAEADPGRCVLVSADGDEATVAERIWGVVESRFLRRNRQPDPPPHGRERGKKERLQHSPSPALAGEGRGGGVATVRKLRRNSTDAESRLWSRLRNHQLGWHFRRQHPMAPYVLDFACVDLRVAVEADGGQHADSETDKIRDAHLADHGWLMLRFWNNEILQNTDGVLAVIMDACRRRHPHPDPPPQERERGRTRT